MAAKLTEITTQYHKFEDNQVLTKDQLNEFINYFEDQDRMSRVCLSGVGIVCGFDLRINSAKTKITISQGAGVTTDGDLIKLQKKIAKSALKSIDLSSIEYTHYKDFEDSYAGYSFFKKQTHSIGKKKREPIKLWELLPATGENIKQLKSLPNIENKVVLLYLESYAKEGDLCTSIDCDNQGVEQVARLRVLLVTKNDADYIAGHDSVFSKHDVADDYINLPEVAVRRVVLNEKKAETYTNLKGAYYQALNDVNDEFTKNLTDGISRILTDFGSLLNLNLSKSAFLILKNKLKNILISNGYNVPTNFQYRYDCLKDIVDTYNEIKLLLLSLKEECCPNIKAFPKHLLLGQINEIQSDKKHNRHQFYKSPILNCGTNKLEQTKSLVLRLFEIIGRFQTTIGTTKITPSNKLLQLTYRTIPFYYNVQSGLLNSWNFFKTEKNEQDTNLCYHTTNLSLALKIQNPLNYNIDGYDFYRIEGHQGKDYKVVLGEIDDLKREHGLAFDVKALSVNINSENLDVDDYQCEFEDLSILLRAWTAEQDCVLSEVAGFFSGFSTAVPGANVKEPQLNLTKAESAVAVSETNRVESADSALFGRATKDVQFAAAETKYKAVTYVRSQVISDNLTLKENALGNAMKVAINETKGGSVNDIIAKTKSLVADKVNTAEWNSKPDVKDFVINQSIELMALAHILSQRMPNALVDVSISKVDTYKATMIELCELVKKMKASYQSVELSVGLKAFIGIFINQLSIVCCSGKKLQVLLEEINKRKENILLRLQFSKFVEKHPGLEHKAGVQPGGTFVLVYLNKEKTVEIEGNILGKRVAEKVTTTDDIWEMRSRSMSALSNPRAVLSQPISDSISSINKPYFGATDSIREMITEQPIITGRKPDFMERGIRPTDISNNTVIADFSLPYMCCSDCAPVNFIIAKPHVSLRLETDEFCLGKDISPLIFDVSPEDGVIKADTDVAGMTIDGKKLSFDANIFPKEMLGKSISFTVNEQITECEITVYSSVQFDFKVPALPISETEITFIPTGNLDGATFLWSFGDDNLSTDRNPTHKYFLPVNDENKVTVSLTVTAPNGVCQTTVEHDITFVIEEPPVNNCIEETKKTIANDLKNLGKLQSPNSDFVQQIWMATGKLYGGTAQFDKGVLNDIDNYLSGKNNVRLEADFMELLTTTSNIIVEIDRVKFKDDFDNLVKLFALQLRLFYNILGCQNAATIKKSADIIQNILNRIIEILQLLKEMKVTMPATLKEFMKTYSEKVKDIKLLSAHLKILTHDKLI